MRTTHETVANPNKHRQLTFRERVAAKIGIAALAVGSIFGVAVHNSAPAHAEVATAAPAGSSCDPVSDDCNVTPSSTPQTVTKPSVPTTAPPETTVPPTTAPPETTVPPTTAPPETTVPPETTIIHDTPTVVIVPVVPGRPALPPAIPSTPHVPHTS